MKTNNTIDVKFPDGVTLNITTAESFFLEWYNDFLTIDRFAAYHCITIEEATSLIEQGRIDHKYRTDQ